MKYLAACCLLAFLTFSCSESTTKQENKIPITPSPDTAVFIPNTIPSAETEASQEMPASKTKHYFSDPTDRDTFRLVLKGESLIDARAIFTIQNPKGDTIWKETFPASDLEAALVYEMTSPIATLSEREAFIRKRVKEFFDEKNFSTPAVAPADNYHPAFGDQVTWQTVKNDKNAVGFSYLLGKENGRRIAFSKLNNKVMLVGSFGG